MLALPGSPCSEAPSAMSVPSGTCPLSLPFSCSPSRQHALTLRGVEMSAGMWAGKKRKQILRLVQTYSCLYWSLGVTSEQGDYKHQQDPLGALKPANMGLQLEKQLLILSLLCILSKVRSWGVGSLQAHSGQHQDSQYGTAGRVQCSCSPDSWQTVVCLQSSAWESSSMVLTLMPVLQQRALFAHLPLQPSLQPLQALQ